MFTNHGLRRFYWSTSLCKKNIRGRNVMGRLFSVGASEQQLAVKILFGSQSGTSQYFATQLADTITSSSNISSVVVSGLHEASPEKLLGFDQSNQEHKNEDALIFLLSCFGPGQPTDNAKPFFEWLNSNDETVKALINNRKFAVFGLGNSRAHAQYYNIVGKSVDKRLEELGGKRLHSLGLGDDAECIEDDFDEWSKSLVETLSKADDPTMNSSQNGAKSSQSTPQVRIETVRSDDLIHDEKPLTNCASLHSSQFSELVLNDHYPEGRVMKKNLFDYPNFYAEGTFQLKIISNRGLAPCQDSLREAIVSLSGHPMGNYEVGDLLWIYPQNHPVQVAAYAKAIGVNPFAIIEGVKEAELATGGNVKSRPYPYPIGLTVSETLQNCVDLSACPSLSLARAILGPNVDYKAAVVEPRRTTLDLMLEPGSNKLNLNDLLFQLPPMRPRYYSIASSPTAHPHEIMIVYRPVKYVTSRGELREGVTTSYLSNTVPSFDDDEYGVHKIEYPTIAAGIMRNPAFRLPKDDPLKPIMMIAGGCGIAPFRSFLDERLSLVHSGGTVVGDAYLFFGVRNEDDEVYNTIIEHALESGALSKAVISHSNSCCGSRFVSSDITAHGALVYDLLQRGGNVYLCGGASGLAWTCVEAIKAVIVEYGKMSVEDGEHYFAKLLEEGRYAEDISD